MKNPVSDCRLYGILDTGYVRAIGMAGMARALIEGGVQILQLRAKKETPSEILPMAREIAPLCRSAGIPFLINDHPELVTESGADGAHVGQDDMTVAEARRLAGPQAIIGKSTHSLDQAITASRESPDYIGFGPLFATPTKPDYQPIGVGDIMAVHETVHLPIFCIGGIKESNLGQLVASGARRVVIVSDLLLAPDPTLRALNCRGILDSSPLT